MGYIRLLFRTDDVNLMGKNTHTAKEGGGGRKKWWSRNKCCGN